MVNSMGKKKKRKEEKKINKTFQTELIGALITLIVIVALCGYEVFGKLGTLVYGFFMFLAGAGATYLAVLLLILGIYIIVTREVPNLFKPKLIGLYIFLLGFLTLSHSGYFTKLYGVEIITNTFNNLSGAIASNDVSTIAGGGIIGALMSCLLLWLFKGATSFIGIYIIAWILMVIGVILFSGITIYDMIKMLKETTSNAVSKVKNVKVDKKEKEVIEKIQDKYEEETSKPVYATVDELINKTTEKNTEPKIEIEEYIDDTSNYILPSINLLNKIEKKVQPMDAKKLHEKIKQLEEALSHYDVIGKVVDLHVGPCVTQFEVEVQHGIKLSRITGISRELSLELAAKSVSIQAPIPGKSTVGIEIPNDNPVSVSFREVFERIPNRLRDSKLLAILGKDIMGEPQFMEINKTPHLLVAGSTGSGKSVCINGIISSILMRTKPDEVKLVLVDPKKVEFSMYNGVPHLLIPVVTDPKKANIALKKIVAEMERRYEEFEATGTKNIAGYNALIESKNKDLPEDEKKKTLPFIVVVIDELADLMTVVQKEVEESIMRITQMARAAGIHLIVATQRPSTDIITGVIKNNIPSRIAFAVSSSIDSRTILDSVGAEKLLGKGDMLFSLQGSGVPHRIQGAFITDDEIKKLVDYTIAQQKANYDMRFAQDTQDEGATTMVEEHDAEEEPLYNEVVKFVVSQGKASASLLQRKFHFGYNRAARCVDLLEERGIVGPQNGSKPREVLVKVEEENNIEG